MRFMRRFWDFLDRDWNKLDGFGDKLDFEIDFGLGFELVLGLVL